jgi:diadenosine tetraphosphate (Ap4A) HIT family hydrolase
MSCIFCEFYREEKYIVQNDLAFAIFDNFPVNKGHVLIIPKRHFASYFDATQEELIALNNLIQDVKALIDAEYKPDGYNLGVNIGVAAGQTICV